MIRTLIKEEERERDRERDFGGFTGIGNISMEYRNPCKYYDIA